MKPVQQSFLFGAKETPPPRNLVIEAGAGTGKTTAIVAEVLKLMLQRDDLALERIVLMTFTEKAAGEIADRIREALEELAEQLAVGSWQLAGEPIHRQPISWPIGSPNPLVHIEDREGTRRAIAHHLANIDALRSQTIHSFCQSLLRAFPIEAGLDPQFKIVEGFERSLLHGQVYDAWIDEETRVHPTPEIVAEWELLFEHVGYLFMIRDLVLNLLDRRDLLGEAGYDFGDFSEVEPSLTDAVSAIRRCADDVGDDHARKIFSYLRSTQPPWGDALDAWIEYLRPIDANILEANLPRHGVLKEALKILRAGDKGRSIYDRLVGHRATMALLALTRRFIAFLDTEKRKLGVVDFDDLLLRTLALLDDPAVLARARAQFDYIFVDEFQDTDRTQARIIDRLAKDESGAYVAGKTIVVGDPKQSIYGFRRADPETYYQMTEKLVAGGANRDRLGEQYRSDAPLLDVVNAMFVRLFPEAEHDPNVFRPTYKPLHAARTTLRRELDARVTLLHAQHDEKSDRFLVEANAIAEWIRSQRDGSATDLQRFAILFRRLTKIDDYLDVLDRYGIDYVLPPTRLFLDRRAPVDLLAVLRAIAYPFDVGAQISAMRSPYFALTDVEVVESSSRQVVEETLEKFRAAAKQLTVSGLIDLLIESTAIERVYDAAADGARHLRHLEHVRSIAFEYDTRIGGSVRQFVDEISQRRTEPEETEPSLIDDSKNAVRIMTVHGAKGLEFDTVILPDLSVQPPPHEGLFTVEQPKSLVMTGRAQSISANFRYTADGEKLKRLAKAREDAETQRLFYVAVTRAKTDVVFVPNAGEKKSAGFHRCLLDVLGVDQATLASLWPERGREVRDTLIGPIAFEKIEVFGATARSRRRLRDATLEAELVASDIVPFEAPALPAVDAILPSGEIAANRAASRNRAAGILLHRVLELWDGRADIDPLLRQLAVEAAADDDVIARVRKRLTTIARSNTLQRILRADTIGTEFPVHFVEEGAPVERRIDRLIREDGRGIVVDYKSGAPDPDRVAKDRVQVEKYCQAIRAMTSRPCDGVLWYVDLECDEVVEI